MKAITIGDKIISLENVVNIEIQKAGEKMKFDFYGNPYFPYKLKITYLNGTAIFSHFTAYSYIREYFNEIFNILTKTP